MLLISVVKPAGPAGGVPLGPACGLGVKSAGAGRLLAMVLVPSRTSDGSAVTAGLTWIVAGEADIARLRRRAAA